MHRLSRFLILSTAAGWFGLAPDAHGALSIRTVVLTGEQAPGAAPGVVFEQFNNVIGSNDPIINNAGQVVFGGQLSGPGIDNSNQRGLWSEAGGSGLGLVARHGEPAPGAGPGVVFSFLAPPVLNDAGQVAFRSEIAGPGIDASNGTGIWSQAGGSLALAILAGTPAPGQAPGVLFADIGSDNISMNDAGQIGFVADLAGPGIDPANPESVWTHDPGTGLGFVTKAGDGAPGTSANFQGFNLPIINNSGETVFAAAVTGAGVDSSNNAGIWIGGPGAAPALVAREGDPAPGTSGVFTSLSSPYLNAGGYAIFAGNIEGPGIDGTNMRGLWSGTGGSGLSLVSKQGDDAPGTDKTFGFFASPAINPAGQSVFIAGLTGPGIDDSNNTGIWSDGAGGGRERLARDGDAAPGTGPGIAFSLLFPNRPVINAAGQIAFMGELTGAGVDNTNNKGFWATDPDGELHLIVRSGDLFDVDDDPLVEDLRAIESVWFEDRSGGAYGQRISFNDAGDLVVGLGFTDGSEGIFVIQVPEPGSLAVMLPLAAAALRRRRRPAG